MSVLENIFSAPLTYQVVVLVGSFMCLFLGYSRFALQKRKPVKKIQTRSFALPISDSFDQQIISAAHEVKKDAQNSVASIPEFSKSYNKFVNPRWVDYMAACAMNVEYVKCIGTEMYTADNRCILDFLASYSVQNAGHNHPHIVNALAQEITSLKPAILHCCHIPEIAGVLAEKLVGLASTNGASTSELRKVMFVNTGSEGIEGAIKLARATTKRNGLIHVKSSFHGLTCGSLSLNSTDYWIEDCGDLLPDVVSIELNDTKALETFLQTKQFAAFVIEPILAEAGVYLPDVQFLQQAEKLCKSYGTLFIADEVQTGVYRTGSFLCCQQLQLNPDIVVLAKALSGGLIPVGAVLMKDFIYYSVFTNISKSAVQFSTFGENRLAMRAGIASLEVMEREKLGEMATESGEWLREELRRRLLKYPLVKDIRGRGLLCGVEFCYPPTVYYSSCRRIMDSVLCIGMAMKLFREHNIFVQPCGSNKLVLKISPPLNTTKAQLEYFVDSLEKVVDEFHTSTALGEEVVTLLQNLVGHKLQ